MKHIDTHYASNGRFKNRNVYKGIPGTVIDDSWLNSLQDEVINFIQAADITLNETDNKQLLKALDVLVRQITEAFLTNTDNAGNKADADGGISPHSGKQILIDAIHDTLIKNMSQIVKDDSFVSAMENAIKRTTTEIINAYLNSAEGRKVIFDGAVSVVESEAKKATDAANSAIASNKSIDTKLSTITHSEDNDYKTAIAVPAGTTAERGASKVALFRYNTELKRFEGCDGTKWGGISGGGITDFTTVSKSFTVEPSKGYLICTDDIKSNNLNVTLLADGKLENGASIALGDYDGRAYDNPFTITPAKGTTINGRGEFIFNIDYAVLNLTYIKSHKDWRITSAVGESSAPSFVSRSQYFYNVSGQQDFGIPNYAILPNQVDVFLNGYFLIEGQDYSVNSLGMVHLNTPILSIRDNIVVRAYNRVQHASIDRLVKRVKALSNPNLLINGDFQEWQRGTSVINPPNDTYLRLADMWSVFNQGGTVSKWESNTFTQDVASHLYAGVNGSIRTSNAIELKKGSAITTLRQVIEYGIDKTENQTIGFSGWFYADDSTVGQTITVDYCDDNIGSFILTAGWNQYSLIFKLGDLTGRRKSVAPSDSQFWGSSWLDINLPAKVSSATLYNMSYLKLEVLEDITCECTPFYPDSPSVNHAKCSWYYQKLHLGSYTTFSESDADHNSAAVSNTYRGFRYFTFASPVRPGATITLHPGQTNYSGTPKALYITSNGFLLDPPRESQSLKYYYDLVVEVDGWV